MFGAARSNCARSLALLAVLVSPVLQAACDWDDTIADKVRDTPELSKLERALERSGLMSTLEDDGSLTLFAPTDAAIARFLESQHMSLDELLAVPALRDMLRYHVADPARSVDEIGAAQTITTVEGRAIEITKDLDGVLLNDDVRLVATPIEASNGVIHLIDAVLARPTTRTYTSGPHHPIDEREFTDVIDIPDPGHVRGLEVRLDIQHPGVYWLSVSLVHEASGETIRLVNRPPSLGDDIATTLSDRAEHDIINDVVFEQEEPAYPEASYRPVDPLRFAYGLPAAGRWKLVIRDRAPQLEGWFNEWSLVVTSTEERPDPTLALVRPRRQSAVMAHGFHENLPVQVKRLAGLTGPIQVTIKGDDVASEPVTVNDGEPGGFVPFEAAPGAVDGPRTLRIDARAGDARRNVAIEGSIVTADAQGVELAAHVPLMKLDARGGSANDIWGWTDPETGHEIALVGTSHNTAFVDVTTPTAPLYLGNLPAHGDPSLWRGLKVYDDHVFVISEAEGHGMQVFDLTRLRGVTAPQTFAETAHYDGFGNAHTLILDEESGFGYAAGATNGDYEHLCNGGMFTLDLHVPAQPVFAGCFSGGIPAGAQAGPDYRTDLYTHDAQCVVYRGPDTAYQGHQICITSDGQLLTEGNWVGVVDMTDKASPVQLSRFTYEGAGYTHQGWLTEDHQYFLLNDEFDEFEGINTRTYIFDMRDLDAPVLIGTFDNPRDSVGHNSFVRDGFLYQANYTSGLRVVDLAGVANASLAEVAYFDTYPDDDAFDDGIPPSGLRAARGRSGFGPGGPRPHDPNDPRALRWASFEGAWSNYPFFASGTIVISDINRGLFVLRRTAP